jgi:Spy/CpxP family protein refolding chaperone
MNTKTIVSTGMLASALWLAGCENATHTQREAAIGATAGAVIGGIVGNQSGDTAEGAAIGAAAGGAIGAAHGSGRDARERTPREEAIEYSDEDYRELLTAEEVDVLRARAEAAGRRDARLTDFLTAEEKENLRRRDRLENRPIGR